MQAATAIVTAQQAASVLSQTPVEVNVTTTEKKPVPL
jgi:hypothetical protein